MNNGTRDYRLEWAYAAAQPSCSGLIKSRPDDFQVDEVLGFEPDGRGNHLLLHIRKRETNTDWLARQLAELAGVPHREVGYAGLKDRHALTTQYFTLHLPGKEHDWSPLENEDIEILSVTRHGRKLRRGDLRENRFTLLIRELKGDCSELEARLDRVSRTGVPNYFGEQRFGRNGANLKCADALFSGTLEVRDRHLRGLYLSAARSWLFNKVLSSRVSDGSWLTALPGEALLQAHSRSSLCLRVIPDEVRTRIEKGFLLPSAPMWGKAGTSLSQGEAAIVERDALAEETLFKKGLEDAGMEMERRALRVQPGNLAWQIENNSLLIRFSLPPGSYATAVLRELVQAVNASDTTDGTPRE